MAKKIIGTIKLQILAGKANPAPPIGSALGQRGLNIMGFCKEFNATTQHLEPGLPTPTIITAYVDKTFSFVISSPPVSYLIKKAAGIDKGSSTVGKSKEVGSLTMDQVKKIAQSKMLDMNANDLEGACQMIIGSAKSMGIKVLEENAGE